MRRIPERNSKVDPKAVKAEPPGPFNEFSCEFNGTSQTVNFGPSAFSFSLGEAISFSFWMKCTAGGGGDRAILSKFKESYNQDGYAILKDQQERLVFLISQGWYPVMRVRTNNGQVNLNTWQHWVVTKIASPITNVSTQERTAFANEIKVYRNGVNLSLNTVDNDGPTDMQSNADFCIGSGHGIENWFQGFLDEIGIWTKELSQAEVTELYNGGVPVDLNSHSAASLFLKGYYRCGDADTAPFFSDVAVNGNGSVGFMQGMSSANFTADVP